MEERWTYDGIRWHRFRDMYRARRNIMKFNREWSSPLEDVGVAYDDQGRGKDESLPDLYHLIDSAIFLILATHHVPEIGLKRRTNEIQSILARTPLDTLLADVPEDEARELRIDLEILGFIPPDITKPMSVQYIRPE